MCYMYVKAAYMQIMEIIDFCLLIFKRHQVPQGGRVLIV